MEVVFPMFELSSVSMPYSLPPDASRLSVIRTANFSNLLAADELESFYSAECRWRFNSYSNIKAFTRDRVHAAFRLWIPAAVL
jgi:hypothetical protein